MMREIKFRAWDEQAKSWITEPVGFTMSVIDGKFHVFGFNDAFADMYQIRVKLQQYTGLKDKNGKEIYEGDLFDAWDGRSQYVVEWDNESAGFHLVWVKGDTGDSKSRHYFPMFMAQYQFEPIGNIYENPELLTNKQGE